MKVGVIGLGAMGAPMARNLHKAGHLVAVYNRTHNKAQRLAEETETLAAPDLATLADMCDLIILCVSRDTDVLQMVQAIAPSIQAGTIVVDTSTVSSATAHEAADILKPHHASFLDCPVSGGVEGACNGTLAMMAGGDPAVLERASTTLDAITASIVHMGPTGSGQATKAVNQIMAAGINQAVTEALAFGEAMDLDMDKVIDIVGSGAAGNWFLNHRGPTMTKDIFDPGFKLELHHKDLEICLKMAEQTDNLELPLTEMTRHDYAKLMSDGHGEDDISGLYRLKKP